jgi:Mlc titration factor MtfA (ptsG expression regulator)
MPQRYLKANAFGRMEQKATITPLLLCSQTISLRPAYLYLPAEPLTMIKKILEYFFAEQKSPPSIKWQPAWSDFLMDQVAFYRVLSTEDRKLFEQRMLLFLLTTTVEATAFEVADEDRLLVAASAVIPVWGFPKWHYFNLKTVFLMPNAFNDRFECETPDSLITGMVGTGPMTGKMVLSRPALRLGFKNSRDKRNVGIHEFVHLIDMADGECDGYPERLKEYAYAIPWFELMGKKTQEINHGKGNIREYAAWNRAEFFAVSSEYFFERAGMLKSKHPELYTALADIYQQDVTAIAADVRPRKKAPCPCGSGMRYKHCCMPKG